MKFCGMVDIRDVITYVNFDGDRLRGLAVAGGQILAFPIDIDRRPYNTLALPCECVIVQTTTCTVLKGHIVEIINMGPFIVVVSLYFVF